MKSKKRKSTSSATTSKIDKEKSSKENRSEPGIDVVAATKSTESKIDDQISDDISNSKMDDQEIPTEIIMDDGEEDKNFEPLPSTMDDLRLMEHGVAKSRSILVRGPVGCGKSFICQYLAERNGRTRTPDFVTVQLGEHMDGKALLGAYQCAEVPGEFTWIPGPLTKAMNEGHWILLEDLNCAPPDALSSLVSVLECRTVQLPGRGQINAHPNFRLFATLRTENGVFQDDRQFIFNQNWVNISLNQFGDEEAQKIICRRYPSLKPIVARLLEAFQTSSSQAIDRRYRSISFRDMLKLCHRICQIDKLGSQFDKFGHQIDKSVSIFREAADCLASHLRKPNERLEAMVALAVKLNVSKEQAEYYYKIHQPSVEVVKNLLKVGRVSLTRRASNQTFRNECIALTQPTCNLLEKLAGCVDMGEPVLLVGETGCGKTASVQFLAGHTGCKLHVVNMSQQSENSDLTGGFKPTDTRHLAKSLKDRFVDLFSRTFTLAQNKPFLGHIQSCFASNRWSDLIALMMRSAERGIENKNEQLHSEWKTILEEIRKFERVTKNCGEGLAFSFIEGVLTKAIKNGDWILLDEINLASSEAIDCLYTLLDGQSRNLVAFDQKDALEPLRIHPDFRLFACMNPSGDVGKRELPTGIRNRFTEIFVAEPDSKADLEKIVRSYLGELSIEQKYIDSVVELYLTLKMPDPTAPSWPCYSLRTLCRALAYTRKNPYLNVQRSLYEACCLSFLTELDLTSYKRVEATIKQFLIGKDANAVSRFLSQPLPPPTEAGEFVKLEGYWLKRGKLDTTTDDRYFLTPTVRRNMRDLARAVAARNYPVLLQGETSVGKTSLIMHLAKLTGNKCVRINNHEHTDIQEYVGTYATDENNKLAFVEGPLVQAMRNGEWIILDELNLSPPDILEALNRVLDDNRELFVAETQETVRAHPDFILFATQNPAGVYGGRKMLSRAFRYRFVELRFNELPSDELEKILQHRCSLPPSYAKKMVNVMRSLQIYRSTSGVFVGRESYMTLRDLFRWGERYRLATTGTERFSDWDQYLADQGYLLLGCRARREEDEEVIRDVLKTHFARAVSPELLFAATSPYFLIDAGNTNAGFEHLVWTLETRRLAVLIGQALKYGEPLLLIGETGCGKTTLCQLFADVQKKLLRMINCHLMTEAADFLGRLAPVSAEKRETGALFEWRDGPLVSAMRTGCPILIDEISLADDSVLERLNSVLEPERTLLLAEKGANSDGFNEMVSAVDGFALMATMNPGGDYGKKELSRALRNRFTEIWCRNEFNADDFVRIVEHNIRNGLRLDGASNDDRSGFGEAMLRIVSWFSKNCPLEYARLISLRDVMDWIKFTNRCSDGMQPWLAFLHGAMVTFIDGLGGNKSMSNKQDLESFRELCMNLLIRECAPKDVQISRRQLTIGGGQLSRDESKWGLEPFFIHNGESEARLDPRYSFETPVCRKNLFRLLRAMQLEKPVLLEGSPGVGKTSLVSALAKATGHRLTRINLSEQTDLSDLFGCDLPISTPDGQQAFDWVDGSFLAALKAGNWILIDEMNLASQSVLEGLNACFDHRGEIYIPEIDRTFKVDKMNTRFFACQNPYSQGGNRKGLPKSFLNRFSTVLVESLGIEDQQTILTSLFQQIDDGTLKKMIDFNEKLNEDVCLHRKWGQFGSPWEFNLRDLMRWCEFSVENNRNPVSSIDLVYASRFRTLDDREQIRTIAGEIFGEPAARFESSLQFSVTLDHVSIGDASLIRSSALSSKDEDTNDLLICRSILKPLRYLMHCVDKRQLAILVGKSAVGKTGLIKSLADLCGRRLRTVYLTSDSDSSELLGSFEQTIDDTDLKETKRELRKCVRGNKRAAALVRNFDGEEEFFDRLEATLTARESGSLERLRNLKTKWLERANRGKKLRFSWIDSPLVEALRDGDWLLLENVNYCSPAVLDRLNALLEPEGELAVTERGFVDGKIIAYRPHENFRIFYTMDPSHGAISRAMRNRGVEICILEEESWSRDSVDIIHVLKKETGDHQVSKTLANEFSETVSNDSHFRVRTLLQRAFELSNNQMVPNANGMSISDVLTDPEYTGVISIELAKTDPLGVNVIRDAAYLIRNARSETEKSMLFAALKLFLLRSNVDDSSRRRSLIEWMLENGLLSTIRFEQMWTSLKNGGFLSIDTGDHRWNRQTTVQNLDEMEDSNINKRFLANVSKWILAENLVFAVPDSVFSMAKAVSEGNTRIEIPLPITQLAAFLENFGTFCDSVVERSDWICHLDRQVLPIVLRLQLVAKLLCDGRIDIGTDIDTIRLYWSWLFKSLAHLLDQSSCRFSTPLTQICDSINREWTSERLERKIYTSVRSHITGTNYVRQTEYAGVLDSFVFRCLNALNAAFARSIAFDLRPAEFECRALQRSILDVIIGADSTLDRMNSVEERINQLNCRLVDDGVDVAVFSRRDILMRKLSALVHLYDGRSTAEENSSILPYRAMFDRTVPRGEALVDLAELLEHLLTPVRSDGLLQRFGDSETIALKVGHFSSLPLETSVVSEFLRTNVRNGSIQTAICDVPKFLAEVEKFSTYFWRVGSFVGRFDQRLRKTLVQLIRSIRDDLRKALEQFSNVDRVTAFGEAMENFESSIEDGPDVFYEKVIGFGLIVCSLSTPPANCIDPVVKERTRIEWLREQLQYVETELKCLNGQYELLTGRPLIIDGRSQLEFVHPYVTALLDARNKISTRLVELGEDRNLYRPRISQFETIGRKCREFMANTNENVSNIQQTLGRCPNVDVGQQRILLAKMQNWLRSCESFQRDLVESHSAYTDITMPFSTGLYLMQFVISRWSATVWKEIAKRTSATPEVQISTVVQSLRTLTPPDVLADVPLKELLAISQYMHQHERDETNKVRLRFEAFDHLLDDWIGREEERRSKQDESTYEYKPKAPLEIEKQEELGVSELFPIPATDDDGELIVDTPIVDEKSTPTLDEARFARTARLVLNKFIMDSSSSANRADNRWPLYETCSNLERNYPSIALDSDESSTIPSHVLALDHVGRSLFGDDAREKSLNVYKEWDANQSAKLQTLVTGLIDGAKKLLEDWPDNEALILVCERSRIALNHSATSTIMTLAVVLERLLVDAEQWEKVAARHVSLDSYLQPLRSLLLEWRKMELRSWERLLDDVDAEFENAGAVSILQFGIVWKAWMTEKISDDDILKSCGQLLEASPIGEFGGRTRLATELMELFSESIMKIDRSKSAVTTKLTNIVRYFSEYIDIISNYARKQREPIEKELKDFLKIAKFQDLNIWSIKKSSADAHRKLFKLVKRYKDVLASPVMAQIDILPQQTFAGAIENSTIPSVNRSITPIPIDAVATFETLAKASSYYDRLGTIGEETIGKCEEMRRIISETIDDLREAAAETTSAMSAVIPYDGTEEEKTKLFKRSLQMRQKSMVNFFHSLREGGFSYRKGAALDEKQLNESCFGLQFSSNDDRTDARSTAASEKSYWASVSRKSAFDEVRRGKPNEQIEPQTSNRCFGFAQHLTRTLVDMQTKFVDGARSLRELEMVKRAIEALRGDLDEFGDFPNQENARSLTDATERCLTAVALRVENTRRIWRCCPEDERSMGSWTIPEEIAAAAPKMSSWTSKNEDYSTTMAALNGLKESIGKVDEEFRGTQKSISKCAGFVTKANLTKISSLGDSMLSAIASIDQLLEACTTDDGETNFLNGDLTKAKQSLAELSAIRNSIRPDSTRQAGPEIDRGFLEAADSLAKKILLTAQSAYQSMDQRNRDESALEGLRRMADLVTTEKTDEIRTSAAEFLHRALRCGSTGQLSSVVSTIGAFIERHLNSTESHYRNLLSTAASFHGCYAITIECWTKLLKTGYLDPPPTIEQGGQGEGQFKDLENAGLGEGEGLNDVSDQITDESQIEGLKSDAQQGEQDERKMDNVEKPIEMDDDFDAPMEDLPEEENLSEKDDEEKDDDAQPEMDWQTGEAEKPQEEQLDPGLWEPPPDDKAEQPPLDDETKGADKSEQILAANDDRLCDDREPQPEDQQEESQKETDEAPPPEEEDFDLENVNLDDQDGKPEDDEDEDGRKGEDEQSDTDGDGHVEEIIGPEEKLDIPEEETTDARDEDKNQTAEKTISSSGINNQVDRNEQKEAAERNDEKEEESAEDPTNEKNPEDDDEEERTESNRPSSNDQDSSKADDSSSRRLKKKEKPTGKRSTPELEEKSTTKRQKLSDEQKTMGIQDEPIREGVEIDQAEDDELNADERPPAEPMDDSDRVFSHRPDVGADGAQVVDSASVETALKQSLDTRRALMMAEKEKAKKDKKTVNDEASKDDDDRGKPDEKDKNVADQADENMDDESVNRMDLMETRETASTIHTVMDFYTQASNINFDELLKRDIDRLGLSDQTNVTLEETRAIWYKYMSITERLALELTENLRLVLEPTVSSKLQGDYRSGKRLNIRKLIPYIASQFRKNKIWLRRTKKAKRDYQILLAIDDSSSMADNMSVELAFESLALLSTALRHLEVGRLGVCKFGEKPELLHSLDAQFVESSGASIINRLKFEQSKTNVAELLEYVSAYFAQEATSTSSKSTEGLPAQLLLIVSDGRGIFAEGVERVKAAVQQTLKLNIFTVFVILDNPAVKHSILDIKTLSSTIDGKPQIGPYLETFPFPFYIILRQLSALPAIMGDALRQWFEVVVSQP